MAARADRAAKHHDSEVHHAEAAKAKRISELRARKEGRAQVRPTAEGWKQAMGPDGRPQLQFAQRPRVSQPPVHLADLSLKERQEKLKELGLPAFRAKQLSVHYFQHYTTDPERMSDLPKAGPRGAGRGDVPDAAHRGQAAEPRTRATPSSSCGGSSTVRSSSRC